MSQIGNRIVTRGFGRSRGVVGRVGMVTYGFGGVFREIAKKIVRLGQSGYKRALRELEEVVVWAKLIRVNDEVPARKIEGSVKVQVSKASQLAVKVLSKTASRIRKTVEDVKITVKRIT